MAEHTPGPWMTINENLRDDCEWRVVDTEETGNGNWQICQCFGPDAKANAHLIAAAPDLLAALEGIRDLNPTPASFPASLEHVEGCLNVMRSIAAAAIAKAREEKP